MVLRITLSLRLRGADTTMRVVASLVQLAGRRVHGAALGFRQRAVVATTRAVLDGAAGELCGYGFVDAGAVGAWGVLEK